MTHFIRQRPYWQTSSNIYEKYVLDDYLDTGAESNSLGVHRFLGYLRLDETEKSQLGRSARMPVIGFVSQKGGVGKSTLARALAREAAAGGLNVLVGDLDGQQRTALRWSERRAAAGLEPAVAVRLFDTAADALQAEADVDLLILDGPARASAETLEIAQAAALVVVPSNPGADDLEPTVLLMHELVEAGIPKERLAVALVRVGTEAEEAAARAYIHEAGHDVLPGAIAERAAYRQAQSGGASLTEVRFSGLAGRADALVQAIVDRAMA